MAGSIEKRGENTYRLVYACGYNLDGSIAKYTKTVHCSKKEAEIELAQFVTKIQNGMVAEPKSITFKDFVEIWKRDYGTKDLAPGTYARYVRILETRILPYFGKFKLDKIKPTDIMKFYDMLENDTQIKRLKNNRGERLSKPLSKKTILEHHRLLRAMHPSTISKWFVKFVKECGLPEISFHGLRHTNATLLISQNIDVAVVAARLGHAQISTTFNFYVHPVISHNKVAGNVLENLLIPRKNTENPN